MKILQLNMDIVMSVPVDGMNGKSQLFCLFEESHSWWNTINHSFMIGQQVGDIRNATAPVEVSSGDKVVDIGIVLMDTVR